ncbi:hypothetical protein [Pantoea sp. NGS-ED-1003]|uniref:hypothetical protein n=1 Tax=Pantoea sp. NGS-ED-1003 TaxID=1526743 RepID=UPI0005350B2D|nr:hypothetical protein [Pantoea sp. NGS-ED-1003]
MKASVVSNARYKGDQLCALLQVMNNTKEFDDDAIVHDLISLAFDLSVEVSAMLISEDEKGKNK